MVEQETAKCAYVQNLSVIENEFRFFKADFARELNTVYSKEKKDAKPVFDANAMYTAGNTITTCLGFVLPPYYHINYPLAVKYGGLGQTIGHELMHAFDADNIGNSPHPDDQWLTKSSLEEFEKRADCLVRQYSTYCSLDKGQCVDGALTLGENIADIDGLKVAFTAYKFLTQIFGNDPPIPGMLNYTQDQLLFLTTARNECVKGWHDILLKDEHTPHKPRIDVMMRNVNLFARSFNCTVGSKYAPLKICSVWGDLSYPAKKR